MELPIRISQGVESALLLSLSVDFALLFPIEGFGFLALGRLGGSGFGVGDPQKITVRVSGVWSKEGY